MLKTPGNPAVALASRWQSEAGSWPTVRRFFKDLELTVLRVQPTWSQGLSCGGVRGSFWLKGMMAGFLRHTLHIRRMRNGSPEDLQSHGHPDDDHSRSADDQIVPFADSAVLQA